MRTDLPLSLPQLQAELSSWRRSHGGRGKPIPPAFWHHAVALAADLGVLSTARALGLDKLRLQQRVHLAAGMTTTADQEAHASSPRFVELSAREVLPPSGQVLVEVFGPGGERLRIHLVSASSEQLVALARAFSTSAP